MTEMLDPEELTAPDQFSLENMDDWDLGSACSIENEECEACQ